MAEHNIVINKSSHATFDTISLEGDLTITSIIHVTSILSKHISSTRPKDLVLELSKISYMDSSGLRTIVNVNKQLEEKKHKLFIMQPSESVLNILEETNLNNVVEIIENTTALENAASENQFNMLKDYCTEAKDGWYKVNCTCPVCGSSETSSYIVNMNDLEWKWEEDDPFPVSVLKSSGEAAGYFSMIPNICHECYFTSIEIERFNVTDDLGEIIIKSDVTLEQKNMLLKSVKKRKKMMDLDIATGEKFFEYPRERLAVYKIYELAELCTRTIAILRKDMGPFDTGYINFIALRFAEKKLIPMHIDNARTWFTQALSKPKDLTSIEIAIANFAMMVLNINIGKMKEAGDFFKTMEDLAREIPDTADNTSVNNPGFWFAQAEVIWHKEIQNRSTMFKG